MSVVSDVWDKTFRLVPFRVGKFFRKSFLVELSLIKKRMDKKYLGLCVRFLPLVSLALWSMRCKALETRPCFWPELSLPCKCGQSVTAGTRKPRSWGTPWVLFNRNMAKCGCKSKCGCNKQLDAKCKWLLTFFKFKYKQDLTYKTYALSIHRVKSVQNWENLFL